MSDCCWCGTELYDEEIEGGATTNGEPVCSECVESMSDDEAWALLDNPEEVR